MILPKIIKLTFSTNKLFIFAGQGTQQRGMLDKVDPTLKSPLLNKAQQLLGFNFEQISSKDKDKLINQTQITQPLLLQSHYLYFHQNKYQQHLTSDDYMIGHSIGQYSALVLAGSIDLQQALSLVHLRGSLMKKYTTEAHGMLIVKFKKDKQPDLMEQIKKANLEVACYNSFSSLTVAGTIPKIQSLAAQLKAAHRITSLGLPVSTAFHCKFLNSMKQQYRQAIYSTPFRRPKCKVISNLDCRIYQSENDIRQGLIEQLTNPVLFKQSVSLVPLEYEIIEVGHKNSIRQFAEQVRKNLFLDTL